MTPPALDRLVRACLAKDPDERWQSAADLAREMKWMAEAGPLAESKKPLPDGINRLSARIAWIMTGAAMLAALSISWLFFRQSIPEQRSIRFTIPTEARLPAEVRVA